MKKFFLNLSLILVMSAVPMAICAQTDEDGTTTTQSSSNAFQTSDITPPKFIGGDAKMFAFLDSVLVVPQSALDENISGRVIVRFFVDKDGNVKSPSIQQGLTPECNAAAIEAVLKMPAWQPAMQNGRSVNGFAYVPVAFKTKQITYDYEPTEAELTYDQYVVPDKKWVLIYLGADKELPEGLPNVPSFTMTIDKKKKRVFQCNASCGEITARWNWTLKNYRLSFSKVELKKKKCRGKNVKVIDGDLVKIFKNTKEFRITKEGYLQIGLKDRNRFVPLATFQVEEPKKKGRR